MRIPKSLATLVDYGIIQDVVRPLMSGKEAQVYLVVSEGEERVAKVYKEAQARTFKHRAEYAEGRKTRNSRDQRAMDKRTRHGRARDEAAWRSTEVDMIHRLRDAGVRVPEPHQFIDGVLVMELIKDAAGDPAPRLGDLTFEPEKAVEIYHSLLGEVVRMLCAGVVHGDLSDFNVLMGVDGPAMIDFPQAVDPASNQNAHRFLLRDVDNLHRFCARFAPQAERPPYAEEMWELYRGNRLRPTTKLKGAYRAPRVKTDTTEVVALIGDAREEERTRREARGEDFASLGPKPFRKVVDLKQEAPRTRRTRGSQRAEGRGSAQATGGAAKKKASRRRRRAADPGTMAGPSPASASEDHTTADEEARQRRRRRPKRTNAPRSKASARHRQTDERPASPKTRSGAEGTRRDTPAAGPARPAKKRARRGRRRSALRSKPSEL